MRYAISLFAVVGALSTGALTAQPAPATPGTVVLAAVRITHRVLADGKPLPEGTYELRATNERPTPAAGQSPDAERWVEFVTGGTVVAREVAVVLRDDDRPTVGASSIPSRSGTHVEMLKGGEFLRISVRRGGEQYLLYLPVTR
jgi:hypothetical protein